MRNGRGVSPPRMLQRFGGVSAPLARGFEGRENGKNGMGEGGLG